MAYLSAATQVARAAAVALRGVPCVTLARSEVPREELESEDRACLPDISHHARTGLACKNRQEPLGASCYAGRRLVGRRTIIDHGHLLGGGVAGDLDINILDARRVRRVQGQCIWYTVCGGDTARLSGGMDTCFC